MKVYHLFFGASGLMTLGFCIHVIVDYCQYDNMLNSAPFWIWIVMDALIWLLPAALALIAGFIAKKKFPHKEIKK